MIALDTNVVVRLIVNDDADQVKAAREFVLANDVILTTSVVLETEWILRGAYGYAPVDVNRALRAFLGVSQVALSEPSVVRSALDYHEQGLDFADALHVASAASVGRLATFDRRLARRSQRIATEIKIIELSAPRS
jgi:predicted nucleic acid-binding protein